ncbi:uncharacterized protein LOC116029535 [Ipomoea triloba]|uniref:uncharacterized protein LOC116029535 n=1 Tax=Ipomoea triloba TaxID=35885 RepID=UPI00125E8AE1|nr:uncharacterized protein LOC116029535 [Ipomoea triloba]
MEQMEFAFMNSRRNQGSSTDQGWETKCWEKPAEEVVKINYDSSSVGGSKSAGCGGTIRNHKGDGLGGFVNKIGYCPPLQAEAWGLLRSIQLVKHLGFKNIVLEGDSTQLTRIFRDGAATRTPILNIVQACKKELRIMESWRLATIPRETNAVADRMTKASRYYPKGFHLLSQPPIDISNLMELDRLGCPNWCFMYNQG